tara:strand:- start:5987 stop:6271 length:285 start_codon:yes stop_codon:yes gene_type:complete
MNNVSLCIPKVHKKYDYKWIFKIVNKYRIGKIKKVNIIPYHNSYYFNKVVIEFEYWFNTTRNIDINKHLINGGNIKIIYDEYWFWKCFNNTKKQ